MISPGSLPPSSSGQDKSLSESLAPTQSDRPDSQMASSPSEDSLITPRAPNHSEAKLAQHDTNLASITENDYFSANAINSHSVDPLSVRERPHAPLVLPSVSSVSVNSLTPATAELAASSSGSEQFQGQPSSPSKYESLSPTIHPLNSLSTAGATFSNDPNSTDSPHYPDQSFRALQTQVHPKPRQPPFSVRRGSSASSMLYPSSSTLPVLTALPTYLKLTDERGSKTAGNTPATTPGLYTPRPRHHFGSDMEDGYERSPFPSPYLHPVQPQPPRETHKAEKDVDTFSGRKRINQYEIRKELGRGVHGKVKLARSLETGESVAIKIVQRYPKRHRLGKADAPENKVKREVAILKKASHQNVVSMLEVIDDPAYSKVYIVLEFCELKEVDWRTLGDSAIVYLEEVRQKRIASGVDSPTTLSREHRLLQSANKRKKKRHAKWRETQRPDGSLQFWSLEFADDSENESSRSISRTSSAQTDSNGEIRTLAELAEEYSQFASQEQDEDVITPVPGLSNHVSSHGAHNLGTSDQMHGDSNPTGIVESVELNTVIDDLSRGRKGSVADSLNSQLTEAMEEEVIEEHRYVPVMTIQESRAAFRDAVLGLEYLHYQGIVHRDIKPANLLRTKDHRVKISDFGVSYLGKPMREGREPEDDMSENEYQDLDDEVTLAQTVGTPAFYAPELCSIGITSDTVVTGQIDVWALGVTLYCLLFARTPFTAENTFALMKRIAEDEVFIPRQRLKAVERRPSSRSSSRAPLARSRHDTRMPNEILYDEIDDDLYDLMKRLLIKDPKMRITIKEIKHHPWVLADIPDTMAWIEDTDPGRHTQGKKIEISNKEVAEAVVPLKLVERVKSAARKFTGAIGLGGSRRESHTAGAHVASPTMSQHPKDGHKHNGRVEDSVYSALLASRGREAGHLSSSAAASPAAHQDSQNFSNLTSTTPLTLPTTEVDPLSIAECAPLDVGPSDESTSGSIKTVTDQNIDRGRETPSLVTAGSRIAHEWSTPSTALGGLLNGAGQKLMRSMRSRDRGVRSRDGTSLSPARDSSDVVEDGHSRPSIALSAQYVTGVVGRGIDRSPSGSARASPTSSPPPSTNPSSDRLYPPTNSTSIRQPSPSAKPTPRHLRTVPLSLGGGLSRDAAPYSPIDGDPSEEELFQARELMNRRRIIEDERMSASTNSSRPVSAGLCPPSPDDEIYNEKQLTAQAEAHLTQHAVRTEQASVETAPQSRPESSHVQDIRAISSSSEDRFASGTSESKFPSMQSMLSADSSVVPDQSPPALLKEDSSNSSDTANPGNRPSPVSTQIELEIGFSVVSEHSSSGFLSRSEDEGYVGDNAVETDEDVADSDSDSDGDFIVMSKRKTVKASTASRKNTGSDVGFSSDNSLLKTRSKKSVRSGSTNTVKEIGVDKGGNPVENAQQVH